MFRKITKIFFGCWGRHEWVDLGNGKLTYEGKVLAQCAKCFRTKHFPIYKAGNFTTYDDWVIKKLRQTHNKK